MGKIFVSIKHRAGNKSYNFESFWGGRGRLFHYGGSSAAVFLWGPRPKQSCLFYQNAGRAGGLRVGVYLLTARRPNTFARSLISCAARHTIGCRAVLAAALTCHSRTHPLPLANPGAMRRALSERASKRIAFGTCPLRFQSKLYN